MVEGANSKRGLANRTSSCGCCGRGYGNQARHCSLKGRPSTGTYDNLCSPSNSQPYSHRHAYAYAYAYSHPSTHPCAHPCAHSCAARTHAHADPDPHGHPYADADANPHAHPCARLPRTIPKLGVAILR